MTRNEIPKLIKETKEIIKKDRRQHRMVTREKDI